MMHEDTMRAARVGAVRRGLRTALVAACLLARGGSAVAGDPRAPGVPAVPPAGKSTAPSSSGVRAAPAVRERAAIHAPRRADHPGSSRLLGLRTPLPPGSSKPDAARSPGISSGAAVVVEPWPAVVRDTYELSRLPSQARVAPATGSPATVSAAYVVRAFAGETVLPRASISRGRPDVPLVIQPASTIFAPHRSR